MPRLRKTNHIVDLANTDLSNNMKQRLHELTSSSVINLLNVIVIYDFAETHTFRFAYHDNVLYRYIGIKIGGPVGLYGGDDGSCPGGISWHLVTDIQLEDDMVVFYQRYLQE